MITTSNRDENEFEIKSCSSCASGVVVRQYFLPTEMNHATKSGFAADAQAKVNKKYSDKLAVEALE